MAAGVASPTFYCQGGAGGAARASRPSACRSPPTPPPTRPDGDEPLLSELRPRAGRRRRVGQSLRECVALSRRARRPRARRGDRRGPLARSRRAVGAREPRALRRGVAPEAPYRCPTAGSCGRPAKPPASRRSRRSPPGHAAAALDRLTAMLLKTRYSSRGLKGCVTKEAFRARAPFTARSTSRRGSRRGSRTCRARYCRGAVDAATSVAGAAPRELRRPGRRARTAARSSRAHARAGHRRVRAHAGLRHGGAARSGEARARRGAHLTPRCSGRSTIRRSRASPRRTPTSPGASSRFIATSGTRRPAWPASRRRSSRSSRRASSSVSYSDTGTPAESSRGRVTEPSNAGGGGGQPLCAS